MIGSTAILAVMDSLFSESEFPSHRQSGSYPIERRVSTGAAHAKRAAKRRSNIRAHSKK